MRKLRNTLYIFTEDAYLTRDGENIVVRAKDNELGRIPFITLESIFSFSYAGASTSCMEACLERGISLAFFSPRGKFAARVCGSTSGNILLRHRQYEIASDPVTSLNVAKNFIIGKIYNSRWVLERALRDHSLRINAEKVSATSGYLKSILSNIQNADSIDSLRGLEGKAAASYFGVFDQLILNDDSAFKFTGRNRRPPKDPVNAMLSLFYSVLTADCTSAVEGVGLDSCLGFMHTDKPGRKSLSLDLVEELRPIMVDRFIFTSINNRIVKSSDFIYRETGEVLLSAAGRKRLFSAWQNRKKQEITHPYLKEKIPWGLVPHIQAQLLAGWIREDLDTYPSFLWK